MHEYVLAKFLHILIAILALGTSAGLGIVLEFFGDHPVHGRFVLRAIHRLEILFVIPGYVLMLVTGLWLGTIGQMLHAGWVRAALGLWSIGLLALLASTLLLGRQIALLDAEQGCSPFYRKIALAARGFGAAGGLIVVIILYLMVFKPQL